MKMAADIFAGAIHMDTLSRWQCIFQFLRTKVISWVIGWHYRQLNVQEMCNTIFYLQVTVKLQERQETGVVAAVILSCDKKITMSKWPKKATKIHEFSEIKCRVIILNLRRSRVSVISYNFIWLKWTIGYSDSLLELSSCENWALDSTHEHDKS